MSTYQRRITLILGAAAGSLVTAGFLSTGVASADEYGIEPVPEPYADQIFGLTTNPETISSTSSFFGLFTDSETVEADAYYDETSGQPLGAEEVTTTDQTNPLFNDWTSVWSNPSVPAGGTLGTLPADGFTDHVDWFAPVGIDLLGLETTSSGLTDLMLPFGIDIPL